MKKHLCYFALLFVLLFTSIVVVNAESNDRIYLKNMSTTDVKASDSVEISVVASGESGNVLKSGYVTISYDKDLLELNKEAYDGNYYSSEISSLNEKETSLAEGNLMIRFDLGEPITLEENEVHTLFSIKLKIKETVIDATNVKLELSKGSGNLYCVQTKCDISTNYNISFNVQDSNTNLKSLSIENFALTPKFSKSKTSYKATVDAKTHEINVNAICEGVNCSVEGIGTRTLEAGDNKLEVVVTSEAGTKKTYVLNVYKQKNNVSKLSSVTIRDNDYNTIDFEFDKNTFEYELSVGNDVDFIRMNINPEDPYSTYTEGLDMCYLEIGDNTILVTVIAENNTTTTYTFHVNRMNEETALLSSLKISGYKLDPVFDPNTLKYKIKVKSGVTFLDFKYGVNNDKYTVSISGNENLSKENNLIVITVKGTEENNVTVYNIEVEFEESKVLKSALYVGFGFGGFIMLCAVLYLIFGIKKKINKATEETPNLDGLDVIDETSEIIGFEEEENDYEVIG